MIIGVTRGYKYMRYIYAHFPIDVSIEENKETKIPQVEIRYVPTGLPDAANEFRRRWGFAMALRRSSRDYLETQS